MGKPVIGLSVSMHPISEESPVREATLAEELGFDFVSVPDHPFGGSPTNEPLVTLAWIGAATQRIGLVTRVLGVPFRNPAMVAKMAETIDRFSGGRLVLGLGGGGADKKMRSVGIAPLSAGEKIDGLAEATSIISEMWSNPQVTRSGRQHGVVDAEISPRPARRIPIWLGVLGPRGAELAGEAADGWIPYLRYTTVERLTVCRRRLTAAAERAQRDPAALTCILSVEAHVGQLSETPVNAITGTPEAVAEQMVKFLDLGFDGFNVTVLGPDRIEQATRIAEEVFPLLPSVGAVAAVKSTGLVR
ncbi:LLM class flavin-dependent oxidoreductase [Nonomuraea sp. NPDC051941]|uniref:LLM class flavin-dependent oxidoreductase n=1 Tax=Nonomuraea sp. NPDC051941 TaxID=3364373 RepID=UPI0037CBE145